VLVDANQHVDREGAARAGVGFYGKNTLLITRATARGSCSARSSPTSSSSRRRRSTRLRLVHALHRRVPDRRARRAGHARRDRSPLVLDAGAGAIPEDYRAPLDAGVRLRHLPGRLPVEPRCREAARATSRPRRSRSSRSRMAEPRTGHRCVERYDRLYVPRNDPRYLRRNALVALGNTGGPEHVDARDRSLGDDELSREHAEWARRADRGTARATARRAPAPVERLDRARASRAPSCFASSRSAAEQRLPAGLRDLRVDHDRRVRRRLGCVSSSAERCATARRRLVALVFDTCVIAAFATIYSFEYGARRAAALIFVDHRGGVALRPDRRASCCRWRSPVPRVRGAGGAAALHDGPGSRGRVTFPFGGFVITGAIVGWLGTRLGREARSPRRAREAEALRDELGRRVDVLEAREPLRPRARSSLDLDQAFSAFIRELRGLVPFERVDVVLVEKGRAR
jgi:hypothetical protein